MLTADSLQVALLTVTTADGDRPRDDDQARSHLIKDVAAARGG